MSLLYQVEDALTLALNAWTVSSVFLSPGGHVVSESGISARLFASKPPARLAVVDARLELEQIVLGWTGNFAEDTGLPAPAGGVPVVLRFLHDEAATLSRLSWAQDMVQELSLGSAALAAACEIPLGDIDTRRAVGLAPGGCGGGLEGWLPVERAVAVARSYGVQVSARSVYRWVRSGRLPAGEVAVGVVGVRVVDVVDLARLRGRDGA